MKKAIVLSLAAAGLMAGEVVTLDPLSVTATKFERETKYVPQSVTVVDSEEIEDRNVLNVKDALETIPGVISMSKNNGYDSRLIIRGAGLKARYGIREIMVMRDGVPMTDPDSFTRMDFIDVDDIESVEVFKGPGSIYAANTSGGVVFITSKSVFDTGNNRIKLGYGNFGTLNANIKATFAIDDNDYVGISLTRRQSDNDWREWNVFDTTQASLKYGHIFEDDATFEAEFAYTDANLQLPQSLKQAGFDKYKDSGKAENGDAEGAWQKSGRYSKSFFLNLRYEKSFGDLTFRPQAYVTKWEHFHPVTGMINDAKDNYVYGADLAFDYAHAFLGDEDASLVFGLTGRSDVRIDGKKYEYRDYDTGYGGRIVRVTSDAEGNLASTEDGRSTLYGGYLQESFSPLRGLSVDVGVRYERLVFDLSGNEITRYDYASGTYVAGGGAYDVDASYNLWSPKIGATYALTRTMNAYALVASANQAPTDSEVSGNHAYDPTLPELKASTSINYEVGLKQRSRAWSMDLAFYLNDVSDEIVAVKGANNVTYYNNAGKTRRMGAELSTAYQLSDALNMGATGSLQDYKYITYVSADGDFSGNHQRFIPEYQYSLFGGYKAGGFASRIEAISFGPYYMDDANTEKYDGFTLVTNLMLAYSIDAHRLQLNVNNLFDQRYATEVNKVTSAYSGSTYYYTPATPRFAMATYTYSF